MDSKYKVLSEIFGYGQFRPLQEQVIDKILAHEDVLLILPTGGGKSLCYQLPALLMPGVLVVVSPLLALMQDQVRALEAKGVKAAMMSSMQSALEINKIEQALQGEKIKVVFVAPERLQNQQFLQFLQTIKIAFFAIDEAHCVSEWGHEFRSDYRQLGLLKQTFPDHNIAAFTATATPKVQQDIVQQLHFSQADNIVRGQVYRDNLFISTQARQGNGHQQLLDFLADKTQQQGIVYTLSRKQTEQNAEFLNQQGFKACAYHAGLSTQARQAAFNAFVNDEIDIMVATIAFGMGIDKSNIRYVVHLSLPKTMEAYYQEMGRAGRDGLPAQVLLLYSTGDLGLLGRFINDIDNPDYRQQAFDKLDTIKKYAFSEKCRHQILGRYFEDEMPTCKTQCDNCLNPDDNREDISELAKMFLSTIYRTKQQFGAGHIIDVLMGSKKHKVLSNQHDKLSVYDIGCDYSKAYWKIIADRLLELDVVSIGEFRALKLTDNAKQILKSNQTVDIRSTNLATHKAQQKFIAQQKSIANKSIQYQVEDEILMQFKALRTQIAKADKMPAYIVFDDKTLQEIAYFLPNTEEKFLQINGVGQLKLEKYFEQFLLLITRLRTEDFIEPIREEVSTQIHHLGVNNAIKTLKDKPTITAQEGHKTPVKKLNKTYLETLALVEQKCDIFSICEQRGFVISTILVHINKLVEYQQISPETRQQLFENVPTDPNINQWIEQGLALTDLANIQYHLAIFKQLHQL